METTTTTTTTVIIVGAGPSGLSTAACLSRLSIPYKLLEREDCSASLWRKYAYDRLSLHLPKSSSELAFMEIPSSLPTYLPKNTFLEYLDSYISRFGIQPLYRRNVEAAEFDSDLKVWKVRARIVGGGEAAAEEEEEEYVGRFLVVATGETADPYTPAVEGVERYGGGVMHSTRYKSGKGFEGKRVLVVGAGNSGMEIALDLANHGAVTSILVRSPVHIMTKRMMNLMVFLAKYLPLNLLDSLMVFLSKIIFGDLTKYGMRRPEKGPIHMKMHHGKYPIIDLGTFHKIKSGQIQVLSSEISKVESNNNVIFKDGKVHPFDSMIFCTGFRSSAKLWLKGDDYLLNDDGLSKGSPPNHWKGKNGLYCVGLSRRGLYGSKMEAQEVAKDILAQLQCI